MNNKKTNQKLTITEAVEALTSIIDLETENLAEEQGIDSPTLKSLNWLDGQTEEVVDHIKDIFKVVYKHLRHFYQTDFHNRYDPNTLEEIKTIMVLVGDATKKLDKFKPAFHITEKKNISDLKEYKSLQEFYLSRVANKIDKGVLGKLILDIFQKFQQESAPSAKNRSKEKNQTKHVFIDLDSVKKDTEYELVLLRKEDGTRFFSPRLIRNIKLVSDFGGYFGIEKETDPLIDINFYQDRIAYNCATTIISLAHEYIDQFYSESISSSSSDMNLVRNFSKTLMALMLAANNHNLSHQIPIKNCYDYFCDFQFFLRTCVCSHEYKHLIAYPNERSTKLIHSLLNAIQAICHVLYTHLCGYQEMLTRIHGIIHQAVSTYPPTKISSKKQSYLADQLKADYEAVTKLMKIHPNGPLNKILESIETGNCRQFDPLIQGNLPSQLYTLYVQECKIPFVRWPSPTSQEYVNKADIAEEFKAFLYSCSHSRNIQKCLMINLQDRQIWKESARCEAIEGLSTHEVFEKEFIITSFAKDTEFYHQDAPYAVEDRAEVFIEQFKQQLSNAHGGYYFPKAIHETLFDGFVDQVMQSIHRIFYSDNPVLQREQRLDFIEIFYLFLELKIIECVNPDIVGFCCKDGIDLSITTGTQLYLFLKLLNQERLSESDREQCDLMLYGPSLLLRERTLLTDRFNRMYSAIHTIESLRQLLGQANFAKVIQTAFGEYYKTPILQGKLIIQHKAPRE